MFTQRQTNERSKNSKQNNGIIYSNSNLNSNSYFKILRDTGNHLTIYWMNVHLRIIHYQSLLLAYLLRSNEKMRRSIWTSGPDSFAKSKFRLSNLRLQIFVRNRSLSRVHLVRRKDVRNGAERVRLQYSKGLKRIFSWRRFDLIKSELLATACDHHVTP